MAKQKVELYGGEVLLDFFDSPYHHYKHPGERKHIISVTAVTGMLDKSRFLIPWATGLARDHLRSYFEKSATGKFTIEQLIPVVDEACEKHASVKAAAAGIGDKVHEYAEAFGLAELEGKESPEIPKDALPEVVNGINAFLGWVLENEVVFEKTEKIVYSKRHDFAGTFDLVAQVNGRRMLIDYKTSKRVYDEYAIQLAGYAIAYEEETGDKPDLSAILHFDKETGKVALHEYAPESIELNKKLFLHMLEAKKIIKEAGLNI